MKLLYAYLKNFWKLMLFILLLACINTVFSMMDPLILGKMIDRSSHFKELHSNEFFKAIGVFLLLLIGVAMVSRIAKNFQDYYTNELYSNHSDQLHDL